MKIYTVKATKDLIQKDTNGPVCFTKGKEYTFHSWNYITEKHQLMNITLTNDQGEKHEIGTWYKHFKLVNPGK